MTHRLNKRLDELERVMSPALPKRWHQLIVDEGEDREAVQRAYEAGHGPIGDDGCIIWVVVVSPPQGGMAA
jgi:hypothetical protein